MHLQESAALIELRRELRAYFSEVMDAETSAALEDPERATETVRRVVRQMGKDGWLGIGWPKEFGGQGRGPVEQLVFYEEVQRAGAPYPLVTLNTVGPTLMARGTPQQQEAYLPGILAGEIHFAIGYTEPQSGTDLASLRTRAVRDGDHYVVNGNKVFTTGGELADYVWLACRTDADAPRHRGISILIVDTTAPGFSWSPIETVGTHLTTATYYDNIHVPVDNLVGEENGGWKLITAQLNHERVALGAGSAAAQAMYEAALEWARATEGPGGGRVIDQSWVQSEFAQVYARLEALRLLNHRMAAAMESGQPGPAESSTVKVLTSESAIEVYRILLGVLGAAGQVAGHSPEAIVAGRLERLARHSQINTFGGGVNEIQRELIAVSALGLPRGHAMTAEALRDDLLQFVGAELAPPRTSADGVNAVMIRHWCQALDDANPRYAPGPDQVAPPAMLQAWCMREGQPDPVGGPAAAIDALLHGAGYTAVVATNCEQRYERDLRPGDTPVERRTLESVSPEKTTALGRGFFLTVVSTYEVDGEAVATMRFRTLRYQPAATPEATSQPAALRPRAALNDDNRFFFEGLEQGELLVRRCCTCGRDQHPPLPMCPACGGLEWEARPAATTGTVYTFTVTHHPAFAGFDMPLVVALVELDAPAGTRLVTNLLDIDPDAVRIGLPVEVDFVAVDPDLTLPLCRPAAGVPGGTA